MDWFNQHGGTLIEAIVAVLVVVGAIVGGINGPRADKARTWLDWIVALLRRVSPVTYKDEPKSLSMPLLQGDSGERVVATEKVK